MTTVHVNSKDIRNISLHCTDYKNKTNRTSATALLAAKLKTMKPKTMKSSLLPMNHNSSTHVVGEVYIEPIGHILALKLEILGYFTTT